MTEAELFHLEALLALLRVELDARGPTFAGSLEALDLVEWQVRNMSGYDDWAHVAANRREHERAFPDEVPT